MGRGRGRAGITVRLSNGKFGSKPITSVHPGYAYACTMPAPKVPGYVSPYP